MFGASTHFFSENSSHSLELYFDSIAQIVLLINVHRAIVKIHASLKGHY
jgi:hypothetical protein